ncbi:MAG: protein kinase [Kouleothrix sp.]|nr:protein kinase [Kouleothrix sp.]
MPDINLLDRTLGQFKIVAELGRGGMAVVYKAYQTDLQRAVALKVLPPELSLDGSYLQRFLHEARSVAALEHPHIVPIYAIGEAEGFNYIAMKFIAGQTLKQIVQERGALEVREAAAMLEQVADALDYAHSQGVIHRDIKPSNMMAERNGWVYLTDFGLARGGATSGLTITGTVMGTPEYMSPEQAQGLATIGPPTDIYALGVVLYEMLTGHMPFQADTPLGMLVARLQHSPRPPRDYRGDLPLPVEDVIMRALARRPEARFATATELIAALKAGAGLGTRSFAPQQRPISPPLGTPLPASPPLGTPLPASLPTQAAPQPQVQPYVISTSAAAEAPRAATPPPPPTVPAGFGALPPAPVAPPKPEARAAGSPRSRRGLAIALGAIVLVLVAALLIDTFVLNRVDPRIEQGLTAGQAAIEQKGGLDRAIAAYKQVLEADPKNVVAHTRLALIYTLRDRNDEAEAAARAATAADPRSALAYAVLSEALGNQSELQDALAAANKAVELNDKLPLAYIARADIKASQAVESADGDQLKEAAADADKAIELAQKEDKLSQALAHSARGYVFGQEYALTGDESPIASGVEEFDRAIALQGQIALFHSNQGYFYDAQEDHDRAKEAFEAALDADDQYGHAHSGLGWNLYYLEDYQGALGEFDKALELNPRDVDAYIGKSSVYQYQETPDYDQAIEQLQKAAEIAPKSPRIFADLGWVNRTKAGQLPAGDSQTSAYAESEAQFRKAIGLNDRYVDAVTGLGWVLQDQAAALSDDSKYQDSVDTLKRALELKEDRAYTHNALGWSYYGLRQYDQAKQAFERAIELKDDYGDAFYGLGRTLQDQGQADDARKAYESAIDHGSDRAKDALDTLK